MDYYGVCNRSQGRKPFLLLDGHGSRFQESFLSYVINPRHEWVVCIGVPYGTALWQVGDSSEQNGSYKVALAQAKSELIAKKRGKSMKLTIDRTDIIPLVNYAWCHSFGKVTSNKKAIRERGWYPPNRNILLDSKLRSTITAHDENAHLIPSQFSSTCTAIVPYITPDPTLATTTSSTATATTTTTLTTTSNATFNPKYLTPVQDKREYLNYSSGTAAFCLDRIVQNHDLMEARERIKKERTDGKNIEEMIQKQKGRFTAGKAFSAGLVRIGKTVFDRVTKHTEDAQKEADKKRKAVQLAMAAMISKSNEVKALGKSPDNWTIAQIKTVLAPLKRKGDKALPTKKNELLTRLREWESRDPLAVAVANEAEAETEARGGESENSQNEANEFGAVQSI